MTNETQKVNPDVGWGDQDPDITFDNIDPELTWDDIVDEGE